MIKEAIEAIVNDERDLTEDEAAAVMGEIFSGEVTPAQISALLVGLRMKGESVDEIAGMARVMRDRALQVKVDGPLLDTCGTGGSGTGKFNVSTTAAFVAAGAGARLAKHGNRAMSSACGSADVLEALGARVDLTPEQVAQCIEETGFGFMFAQAFHPSMKHAGPTRREIGVRTAFNLLGPLTNPARAQHQVLGVARSEIAPLMAAVLERLGSTHALVVHGHGGTDELTLDGQSEVYELHNGDTREYTVSPKEFRMKTALPSAIRGGTPAENAAALRSILAGEKGPLRDVVLLNAGAALVAADIAKDISNGIQRAAESIDSGAAAKCMTMFVELSAGFA